MNTLLLRAGDADTARRAAETFFFCLRAPVRRCRSGCAARRPALRGWDMGKSPLYRNGMDLLCQQLLSSILD